MTQALGAGTGATITGLDASTQYDVHVRAENDEGAGAWATPGPYSTSAEAPLVSADVTMSKAALTVTEEDANGDTYTVVLDTQPTADVTVTVAGHAATDLTPNPSSLSFTTQNWETAQTVTVTAADDADTTNDMVTLTHSATSTDTDYDGVTITGVTVTLSDNDTAQVMGVMVAPGKEKLRVTWTPVGNATGNHVQWKSGAENYNTTDRQATVTAASHTILGLANGTEYTVQVIAVRTGANDAPPSAEVKGTPVVTPGVTVSIATLTVTEEDATGDSYTVVLDTQPTADVTVTVAGHAGTSVSLTPDPPTPDGDGDGDLRRRCRYHERFGYADPQRDEHGRRLQQHHDCRRDGNRKRQRHRPGDGRDSHAGQQEASSELDRRGQRHGQPRAVEVGRRELQHHRPAGHRRFGFDHEPHIGSLTNDTEYDVQVIATRTGANDGPPSAEVTGTPEVPPGVSVSQMALTVTEEDTTGVSYTVVLATQPTADVTVTVAGHAAQS